MTKILLIDDHPLFGEGFAYMVRDLRRGWEVRLAASAGAALEVIAMPPFPDLVLIDIGLPDRDGFVLCQDIGVLPDAPPCLLISGREDLDARSRAQASGAHGLISKSSSPALMVSLVELVLAGGTAFDKPTALTGAISLTRRQSEVLTLLAEGHGNKEMRYRLGIAERTVRAHLTELFQVLGAHSRMQAVMRARELGLIA